MAEPTPAPEMTLEEAQKQFETSKAHLEKTTAQTRAATVDQVKATSERLAYADDVATRAIAKRDEMAAAEDSPEDLPKVELLVQIYTHMKQMMAIELNAQEKNLALLDGIGPISHEAPPKPPAFVDGIGDPEYIEARARMDVALAAFHWLIQLDGFDVLSRATSNGALIQDERDAERQAQADALRAATKGDRDLTLFVGQLGAELLETRALLDWAQSSLETLGQLPAPAKRTALADTDWAKLNGKVELLSTLGDRVQAYPALAGLIKQAPPAPLPYATHG